MEKTCKICKIKFVTKDPRRICCSKSCRGKSARAAQKNPGRKPEHGDCSNGHVSKLWRRWASLRARCCNPKSKHYRLYGGRGITVCEEWANSFPAFKKWALKSGYSEELQIDRIDNNKGYSPDNCRWVTALVNNNNRRNSIRLPGSLIASVVSKMLGLRPNGVSTRIKKGMPVELAITIPKVPNGVARKTFKATVGKWKE